MLQISNFSHKILTNGTTLAFSVEDLDLDGNCVLIVKF